jgi:hypothetical protein
MILRSSEKKLSPEPTSVSRPSLSDLPVELLGLILSRDHLSLQELAYTAATCRLIRLIAE